MLTVKEVSSKLNLSAAAIYRYVASGQLQCHRFGNAIRISDSQLADFLERTRITSELEPFPTAGFKHL